MSGDHPQKTTTLKVVDSFKYLGVPIDKDLTMGPLHILIRDREAGREGARRSEKAKVPEEGGLINQAIIG